MTEEQAKFFVEACEDEDIEVDHREGYSGRGMYGKETHGIVIENIGLLLGAAMRKMSDDPTCRSGWVEDLWDVFEPRIDSMGLQTIIY